MVHLKIFAISLLYCLSFCIWRIKCDVNEIPWSSVSEATTSGSTEIELEHSLFDDRLKRAVAVTLLLNEEKPQVENHRKKKRCRKNRRQRKLKLKIEPNGETENNRDNSAQPRYRKRISSAEMEDVRVKNTKLRVVGSQEFQGIDESSENPFLRIVKSQGSQRSDNEEAGIDSFEENDGDDILRRIKNHLINPGDYKVLALVGKKDDSPPQNLKKYICYCKEADCSGKDCQPETYKPCSGTRQNSKHTPYTVGQVNNYGSNKGRDHSSSNAKLDNKSYVQTLAKVNAENGGMNYKNVYEKENIKPNQNTQAQESKLSVQNSQELGTTMKQGVDQIRTSNNNQWLRPILGLKGSPTPFASQGPSQELSTMQSNANLSWLPFLKDQSTKDKNEGEVRMTDGQVPEHTGGSVKVTSIEKPVPRVEKPLSYLGNPEPYLISNGYSMMMESSTDRYRQSEANRGHDLIVESNISSPVSSEEDSSHKLDASKEGNAYLQVVDGPESDEDTKASVTLDPRVDLPRPAGNHDDDVYMLGDSTEEVTGHQGVSDTPQKYELPLMMSKNEENRLETNQFHHQMSGFEALRPVYNPLPAGGLTREFRGPYNGHESYVVGPNTRPSWNGLSGHLTTEIPFRVQLERPAIARSGWNGCNDYPTAQFWPKAMMPTWNNYYGAGMGGHALRNFDYYGNPHAGKKMEDKNHLLSYYSPTMKTGNGGSGLPQQRYPVANENRDDYSDIQVVTNGYFTSKTYDDVEDLGGNDDPETGNAQAEFESNVDRIHHLTQQGLAHHTSNLYNRCKSADDWKVGKENMAVINEGNSRYLESVEDEDEIENSSAVSAETERRIIDEDAEESSLEESLSSEEFTGSYQSKDDGTAEGDAMGPAVHQIIDLPEEGTASSVETVGETETGLRSESDSIEEDAQPSDEEFDQVEPEKNILSDPLGVLEEKTPELIEDGSQGLESKYADSKNDNGEEVGSSYKAHCRCPTDSVSSKKYSENIASAENEGNAEQQVVSNFSPPIVIEPAAAIETSPTKYFSPNDRVLEYIKNHGQNLIQYSDPYSHGRQDAVNQDHMGTVNEAKDEEAFVKNSYYCGEYGQMSSKNENNKEITDEKSENLRRIFTQPSIPGSDEIDEDSGDSTKEFNDNEGNETEDEAAMNFEQGEKSGKDKTSTTDLLSLKNKQNSEDLSRSYEDCTVESTTSEVVEETQYPDNYRSESREDSQLEEANSQIQMKPENRVAVENNGMQLTVQSLKLEDKTDQKEDTTQHRVECGNGRYSSSLEDDDDFEDENLRDDSTTREDSGELKAESLAAKEGEDHDETSTATSVKNTSSGSCGCRVPENEMTAKINGENGKLLLDKVLQPTVGKNDQNIESMNADNISNDKVNYFTETDSRDNGSSLSEFSKMHSITHKTKLEDEGNRKDPEHSDDEENYDYENSEEDLSLPKESAEIETVNSTSGNSGSDDVVSVTRSSLDCNYRVPGQKSTTEAYEESRKLLLGEFLDPSRIPGQTSSTKAYGDSEKLSNSEYLIPAEEDMPKNKAPNAENGEIEQTSFAENPLPKIDCEMKNLDEETENHDMQSINKKSKVEDGTNEVDLQGNSKPKDDEFSNSGETTKKHSEVIGVAQSLGSCIKPPEVQDDSGYLGRIAPQNPTASIESFGDLVDSDLYYIGDGVRLPLTIKRLKDGSFALSVSEKICQQWAKEKCPCCVPREGKILQEKHSDYSNLDSLKKTSRRDIRADEKFESDEMELDFGSAIVKGLQLPMKRSTRSITMPVDKFAEKYNLNLNLEDHNVESTVIKSTRRHKVTKRSEMENETQAQSSTLVQKIVSINEVPENEKVGVLLSTLQELIVTEPTEISKVVDKLEENIAKEKLRGKFGGDDGEEDASGAEAKRLYDYQKENPILERIRIIKQLQMGKKRCEHKYQKDCDYAITQKTELLTTILRWLKELLLTSHIN